MRFLLGSIGTLSVLATAMPLATADDGEHIVSGFVGGAGVTIPESGDDAEVSGFGGTLGFTYERGVTDTVWLRGEAGATLFSSEGAGYGGHATVGVTYAIDVAKYVPYFNLGAGVLVANANRAEPQTPARKVTSVHPLVELGGGVDYLRSRSLSYGLHLRLDSFASSATLFSATFRVSYRWGFF